MYRLIVLLVLWGEAALASDWQHYGGDAGGSRYASAAEVNRNNVGQLRKVWTYQTGDHGEGFRDREERAFQVTPIVVDGVMYLSTTFGQVHAIDAATGELRWLHKTTLPKDVSYSEQASRGVTYWKGEGDEGFCASRIFLGTRDARMVALDALTGKPCLDFGQSGVVDLNEGSRPYEPGNYLITSPPVVYGDVVITGSAIGDNSAVSMELGIVRAMDTRTGEVVWAWDPIPRSADDLAHDEWQTSQVEATGAANAWSILSVDVDRGLVFVPTGSASPDYYGGERLGSNRHANSVVALDALSGELVWAHQLVHHDIWDYDVPSQPVLVDVHRDGNTIPSVVVITKMGMMFVLDRRDGSAVFPIDERPVPASDVEGEQAWPTQPFSSLPSLVSHAPVTADDAWGLTPFDRWHCAHQFDKYLSKGIYTPPSLQGTLMTPASTGGGNWGSLSYDPHRQYAVTNVMNVVGVTQLLPRAEFDRQRKDPEYPDSQYTAQKGTPYGMRRDLIVTSFLGVPCTEPPWGTLAAIDLKAGKIVWQVPLGTTEDLAPWPFNDIKGVPGSGGSIVTAGGLVFIGAALDDYLRAFDIETGEELWKGQLPAGGQATPMSYELNGKQYVVIAAGGRGGFTTLGDYVVAFGL